MRLVRPTSPAMCRRAVLLGARAICLVLISAPVGSQAGAPAAAGILTHAPQILIVPIETPPLTFDFTAGTQEAARELGIDVSGAGTPSASAPVVTMGPVVSS